MAVIVLINKPQSPHVAECVIINARRVGNGADRQQIVLSVTKEPSRRLTHRPVAYPFGPTMFKLICTAIQRHETWESGIKTNLGVLDVVLRAAWVGRTKEQ